ncbi:MAG: hypothetical protein LH618_03755 [Saprospiraceae bacterium]|nr:hypothetical protein [Saprospiraceae bacterium]
MSKILPMQQLIIKIEKQQDLQLLTQLLERLKISYAPLPAQKKAKKRAAKPAPVAAPDIATEKTFDIDKIESLFDKLHAINAFAEITDPVEWQKKLRDEWD